MPIAWKKAENFNIYDLSNNKFIDFTSTIFVTNIGHANKRLISIEKSSAINYFILMHIFIKPEKNILKN